MTRFFRVAPFDASVFITTLVTIGVLGFFVVRVTLSFVDGKEPELFDLGAGMVLAVLVAFSWLRSVKGYTVAAKEVVIDRVGPGKMHIPINDIESADARSDLGAFVRTGYFSMQGLFGWSGKVHVRKPTDVKSMFVDVYGTNPANSVVLRLQNDKTLILTPSDTQGFLEALHEAGVGKPTQQSYLPKSKKKRK